MHVYMITAIMNHHVSGKGSAADPTTVRESVLEAGRRRPGRRPETRILHGASEMEARIERPARESHVATPTLATESRRRFRDSSGGLTIDSPKLKKLRLRRRPREGDGTGSRNESEMYHFAIRN